MVDENSDNDICVAILEAGKSLEAKKSACESAKMAMTHVSVCVHGMENAENPGRFANLKETLVNLRAFGGMAKSTDIEQLARQNAYIEHIKPFLDEWGARLERLAAGPQPRADRPMN